VVSGNKSEKDYLEKHPLDSRMLLLFSDVTLKHCQERYPLLVQVTMVFANRKSTSFVLYLNMQSAGKIMTAVGHDLRG
jgi:hypothetical protein